MATTLKKGDTVSPKVNSANGEYLHNKVYEILEVHEFGMIFCMTEDNKRSGMISSCWNKIDSN